MCHICKAFVEQLDSHLNNFHQLKRQSGQMNRAIGISTGLTKKFLRKDFSKTTPPVASSSDEFDPPHTSTTHKPLSNVVPYESIKKQPEKKQKTFQNENDPKEITKKMPQSSSSELRLRGVFKKGKNAKAHDLSEK